MDMRLFCIRFISVILPAIMITANVDVYAESPLEIIQVFQSDSAGAPLLENCTSPGDLDGDGYSELFARQIGLLYRVLVFSGGNPPDLIPDMIIDDVSNTLMWVPDINGDSYSDFVLRRNTYIGYVYVDVWLGGNQFLSKTEPDLIYSHLIDTIYVYGFQINSGRVNSDSYNDLIIYGLAEPSYISFPPEGRFYIYYGGPDIDTVCDLTINQYNPEGDYALNIGISPGDINGDGFADLVYSSFGSDEGRRGYLGILMSPLDTIVDYSLYAPFSDDFHAKTFGQTLVALGDINKDGFDDFGISGEVYWPCIYYGGNPFDTIPKLLGDTSVEYTRSSRIANIGDINHDGWDDIATSLTSYDLGSGIVYIYFGAYDMDTQADIVIPWDEVSPKPGREFGYSIGPAGDFNGDGVDDFVVSAWENVVSGNDHGLVYVFAGDPNLPTAVEDETETPIPDNLDILNQNYPNPFNNQTIIEYYLYGISEREIELGIYNILGQKVRTLYKGMQSYGSHVAYWDGYDDNNHTVSSGIYFYRLQSANQIISKKMIYLK